MEKLTLMEHFQIGVELLKQVPALGVLVYLVMTFLRNIETRDKEYLDHLSGLESRRVDESDKRSEAIRHLGDQCHAFQLDLNQKMGVTLGKVSDSMDRNTEVLGQAIHALDHFSSSQENIEARRKT